MKHFLVGLLMSVPLWVLMVSGGTALATEPDDRHELLIACDDSFLHVYIGPDHEVGHASYLVVGSNPQTGKDFEDWNEIHLTPGESSWPIPPGTSWVSLWVVLDGLEVDPRIDCGVPPPTTTTSTTTPTTTTTVPPTTTTSTSTSLPVTTTTSLPDCPPPDDPDQPWNCVNTGPGGMGALGVVASGMLAVGLVGAWFTRDSSPLWRKSIRRF